MAAVVLAAAAPNTASARWSGWTKYENHYLSVYVHCWHTFKGECGRNIVDDGMANGAKASQQRVEASSDRMSAWLNPPQEPTTTTASSPSSVSAPVASVAPAPVSTGGTDAIPSYISNCESGGDYSAVNPSSGAYGKYQIMPSTASAYGCDLSSPAGQDQCAAEIYADVGSSAWSCG